MKPSSFVALEWRSLLKHVGVGMGAASFWRGAWYILDDHCFPDDPVKSASTCLVMGTAGMALSQGLMHRVEQLSSSVTLTSLHGGRHGLSFKVARFGALYTIAMSCVLVWRGTWLGWDVLYEYSHPQQRFCEKTNLKRISSTDPGHLTTSGIASHVLAVMALVTSGLFASVLAPPAATGIIRDFTIKTSTTTAGGGGGIGIAGIFSRIYHQGLAQPRQLGRTQAGKSIRLAGAPIHSMTNPLMAINPQYHPSFSSATSTHVLARTLSPTRPITVMSRFPATTRMATSIHMD